MTKDEVAPFDAVELVNGTYCFVDPEFWGFAPFRVIPKYVAASEYPVPFMGHFWNYNGKKFARLGTKEAVLNYSYQNSDVISAGGIVTKDNVNRIISARLSCNDFLEHSRSLTHIGSVRSAALQISLLLTEGGLSLNDLGITGSVLLNGEIDGFSDFDLVIYGSDAIRRAHGILKKYTQTSGSLLSYRTRQEAFSFYTKYDVISDLTADEFADAFIRKYSQGIMAGVPFSIFQVPTRDDLSSFTPNKYSAPPHGGEQERFIGTITDDTHSRYTFKCSYMVRKKDEGTLHNIFCHDRACTEQAEKGEAVEVSAYRMKDGDYCIFQKNGYLKRI